MHAVAEPERLPECDADALGHMGGVHPVFDVLDDDHKLVTAESHHVVMRSHRLLQAFGRMPEQLVACRVAGGVVDLLEAVEVDEQEGQALFRLLRMLKGLGQVGLNPVAVGQAGQHVLVAAPLEFGHVRLGFADVAQPDREIFAGPDDFQMRPAQPQGGIPGHIDLAFIDAVFGCLHQVIDEHAGVEAAVECRHAFAYEFLGPHVEKFRARQVAVDDQEVDHGAMPVAHRLDDVETLAAFFGSEPVGCLRQAQPMFAPRQFGAEQDGQRGQHCQRGRCPDAVPDGGVAAGLVLGQGVGFIEPDHCVHLVVAHRVPAKKAGAPVLESLCVPARAAAAAGQLRHRRKRCQFRRQQVLAYAHYLHRVVVADHAQQAAAPEYGCVIVDGKKVIGHRHQHDAGKCAVGGDEAARHVQHIALRQPAIYGRTDGQRVGLRIALGNEVVALAQRCRRKVRQGAGRRHSVPVDQRDVIQPRRREQAFFPELLQVERAARELPFQAHMAGDLVDCVEAAGQLVRMGTCQRIGFMQCLRLDTGARFLQVGQQHSPAYQRHGHGKQQPGHEHTGRAADKVQLFEKAGLQCFVVQSVGSQWLVSRNVFGASCATGKTAPALPAFCINDLRVCARSSLSLTAQGRKTC